MKTRQSKTFEMQQKVLKGKYVRIQAYLKKQEKSQIPNLTLHLKELEEEQQTKAKARRREIINIRAEINDIQTKIKTAEHINETRSWFFEKKLKNDNPLARLIKKKIERIQLNKITNER